MPKAFVGSAIPAGRAQPDLCAGRFVTKTHLPPLDMCPPLDRCGLWLHVGYTKKLEAALGGRGRGEGLWFWVLFANFFAAIMIELQAVRWS